MRRAGSGSLPGLGARRGIRGRVLAALVALAAATGPVVLPRPGASEPQVEAPLLQQLPRVVVTAPSPLPEMLRRGSMPGPLDVITGEDARRTVPRVLPDALEQLPGVILGNEQGNAYQPTLNLRGFSASPVTGLPQGVSVFLDGVRLNEPTVEEVNFDLIPLDDAEIIQVIRGPSVLFGRNTLGAAINIVTRRGADRLEVVPEIAGGSFGRQQYTLRLGGARSPIDYAVSARYAQETGWRDGAETRIGMARGKLGLRRDGLDATLSYQYSNDRIKQPGSLPSYDVSRDPTANLTAGDFFAPELHLGIVNASYAVTEALRIEANAFVRSLRAEQFNVNLVADDTRLRTSTLSTGGRLQATHRFAPWARDNVLIIGAEYTRSDVTGRTLEEQATGGEAVAADLADTQDGVGVYAQDTLTLFKGFLGPRSSLVLTAAGRWDYLRHRIDDRLGGASGGSFSFSRFNPRVGINLNLDDRVGFFATYGEGFRAPAFLELTCAGPGAVCPGLQVGVAPDPPLKPVVSRTYEVGAYARPLTWLDVDASLFRTDVSDDIFSVAPTGTVGVFFQNIGSTSREGAELSVQARWRRIIEARLGYAFTRATFDDAVGLATPIPPGSETVPAGSTFALVPEHRINLGLAWHPWPWATVSVSASYTSSQFLRGDEANAERPLPAYWTANAGLSARWRGLEGFVAINNLLDDRHETFGTYAPDGRRDGAPVVRFLTPTPPINVVGGLRYTF